MGSLLRVTHSLGLIQKGSQREQQVLSTLARAVLLPPGVWAAVAAAFVPYLPCADSWSLEENPSAAPNLFRSFEGSFAKEL